MIQSLIILVNGLYQAALVLGIFIFFVGFYNIGLVNAQIRDNFTDDRLSDWDSDGLTDFQEVNNYHTDPKNPDTDGDSYSDGAEIATDYDPLRRAPGDKFPKKIIVSLISQELEYYIGSRMVGSFKISSGLPKTPTPKGEFEIIKKIPNHRYKGLGYDFPNTKWNLLFKYSTKGNFYIHGAYWHDDFGKPKSHGCINVSYKNMESLYNWADTGTKILIN